MAIDLDYAIVALVYRNSMGNETGYPYNVLHDPLG